MQEEEVARAILELWAPEAPAEEWDDEASRGDAARGFLDPAKHALVFLLKRAAWLGLL